MEPLLETCTLPTAEQPLRLAELDRLLTSATTGVERVAPGQLRITLRPDPEVAAATASLTVRETRCCSFFTFALTATSARLHLDVVVPDDRTAVLDALAGLAAG